MTRRIVLSLLVAGIVGGLAAVPASAGTHRKICLITSDDPQGNSADGICINW